MKFLVKLSCQLYAVLRTLCSLLVVILVVHYEVYMWRVDIVKAIGCSEDFDSAGKYYDDALKKSQTSIFIVHLVSVHFVLQ